MLITSIVSSYFMYTASAGALYGLYSCIRYKSGLKNAMLVIPSLAITAPLHALYVPYNCYNYYMNKDLWFMGVRMPMNLFMNGDKLSTDEFISSFLRSNGFSDEMIEKVLKKDE